MRRLTIAQLRLLKESKWTKCPACGDRDAYQSLQGEWECPQGSCENFSQRQQDDATAKRSKEASSPLSASRLPTKEDWLDLKPRALKAGGIANLQTAANGYLISTAYFGHPFNHYETMVFGDQHESQNTQNELESERTDFPAVARDNHVRFAKQYGRKKR